MLRGISPLLSPDLLALLSRMGHGDELVLTDAHFPAESCNTRVLRADGLRVHDLLDAIMPLWALDSYVSDPLVMMAPAEGDIADPQVALRFRAAIERHDPDAAATTFISRFDFYDRTRRAFAVVVTGETAKYGNIIIKKGVIPVS
ncbi:MAG: L-fucose mutarotase [Azospirillaceae bacterium]|nr:L-fucose mutarotase [Azospirillaceae bacterium]